MAPTPQSSPTAIAQLKFSYFGRDADANDAVEPTWRDRWDDPQILPLLIRMDVKTAQGASWPTLVVEPRIAPDAGCRGWDAKPQAMHGPVSR